MNNLSHEEVVGGDEASRRAARRSAMAGATGNFMVFYELFVYGFLADSIGKVFFPGSDSFVAFLGAFGVYALAYLARPLGAFFLGRLADQYGRKPVLFGTLVAMCIATTLIGVLPGYGQIGLFAPLLLVALRIIQSFAASGEFGSAVAIMAESAPKNRRGLYTSWQSFTVGLALVAASAIVTGLTALLSDSQMLAWGWRIPFVLAAVFGGVSLYLRSALEESPAFEAESSGEVEDTDYQPLRFRAPPWVLVVFVSGALLAWISGGTVLLQVLPSYIKSTMAIDSLTSQLLSLAGSVAFTVAIPCFGLLSDIIGRRLTMQLGALIIALIAYPLFMVISLGHLALMFLCVIVGGAAVGMLAGPGPAMLAELFPTRTRATGLGVGFNLAEAIFDGNAGLIVGGLRTVTGNPAAAAYYPIFGGIVSLACLAMLKPKPRTQLELQ